MIGCSYSDASAGAEYVDEDFPPTQCDTDGTTLGCESTGEAPASCEGTQMCADGVCAASFNGEIGPFECRTACVPTMDDNAWCFDASACCDAAATCDRGYCIAPEGTDTTTASDTSGDSTDGPTGTGTDSSDSGSSDSSDSGSSDGSGTDTTGGLQ